MIKWILFAALYCFIGSVIEYFLNDDLMQRKTVIFFWPIAFSMYLGMKAGQFIEWTLSKFFQK